ncbi:MAG: hypothetical protein IJZ30_02230 [Alphaproteobacteria bacterium]|nr:hypothetical protein [Alphaproteobacteria bacterium]
MPVNISSPMLKILKSFLLGQKDKDITPSEAEKIQKASYALNNAEIKKRFTPPYANMLADLESPDKQVFEASLYYLTKIAIKKSRYREDIVKNMHEKVQNKSLNPEYKEAIKQQILKISQKNN